MEPAASKSPSGRAPEAVVGADPARATGAGSKVARLWKRTWVGALLSAVLAALLALAFGPAGETVVYATTAVVALLAILEVARMGRFAEHELATPLVAALAAQLVSSAARSEVERASIASVLVDLARPVLVAGAVLAAIRLARGLGAPSVAARAGAAALLGMLALVTSAGASHGSEGHGPSSLAFWGICGAFWIYGLGRALDRRGARLTFALACACAPALAFSLPGLVTVWRGFGPSGLLALVLLSKIGDVFGYYVGSAIGKRRPFPRTSPGKTVAGCVASLVAGVACGGVLGACGLLPAPKLSIVAGMAAGAVVNLAAQAGDLLESKAKRWAGVKDSGAWFGPSGGVLDLVDSLLLAVPAALLAWPLLF